MGGFNCAHPISANGVLHLKSCVWRWDHKSRVTTSLKLFISRVIAPLPPGYLNSWLYLSLWIKPPRLKTITASSVRCPEMTAHTFPHLYCAARQNNQEPSPESYWEHDAERLWVLEVAARLCCFSAVFITAFGDVAVLGAFPWAVAPGAAAAGLELEKVQGCTKEWAAVACSGVGKGSEVTEGEKWQWESQKRAQAGRTEEGRCFLSVKTRLKSGEDGALGHLLVAFSALNPIGAIYKNSRVFLRYHK